MQRIKRTFYVTTGLSPVIWAVAGTAIVFGTERIFSIFIDDSVVLSIVRNYMLVDLFYFLGMALAIGKDV